MLVRDEAGALQVPVFLRPFAEKIFTTGKSVIFLKRLRNYEVPPVPAPSRVELSKEQVLEGCSDLVPFDQSFASALDLWIHSKHHSVGSHLREVLYKDCQLQPSLEALEYVYFFKDGTRLNLLTKTLFEKMDKGKEIWNDRFLLSELVQSVFTNLPCVDARSLTAKTNTKLLRPSQTLKKTIKLLAGLQIDYLVSPSSSTNTHNLTIPAPVAHYEPLPTPLPHHLPIHLDPPPPTLPHAPNPHPPPQIPPPTQRLSPLPLPPAHSHRLRRYHHLLPPPPCSHPADGEVVSGAG